MTPNKMHSRSRMRHCAVLAAVNTKNWGGVASHKRPASAEVRRPSRPSPAGCADRAGLDRRRSSAGIGSCAGTEERIHAEPKNRTWKALRVLRCYRHCPPLPDHRPYLRAAVRSEVRRRHAWFRSRFASPILVRCPASRVIMKPPHPSSLKSCSASHGSSQADRPSIM